MTDQKQIFQEIIDLVLAVVEDGWLELILSYRVEGDQSEFTNTYLIDEGGIIKEKSLPSVANLDLVFRKLQSHLSEGSKEPFTKCKLWLSADGEFNADYSYEKIDWDDFPGWNFNLIQNNK